MVILVTKLVWSTTVNIRLLNIYKMRSKTFPYSEPIYLTRSLPARNHSWILCKWGWWKVCRGILPDHKEGRYSEAKTKAKSPGNSQCLQLVAATSWNKPGEDQDAERCGENQTVLFQAAFLFIIRTTNFRRNNGGYRYPFLASRRPIVWYSSCLPGSRVPSPST